ncbi:cupin [Candidatus Wirthbacteria bacterium CG2_30_54_11]|uniref:Cupin n=1 Tax=Candidatus Wirthbacteria bacterium CG2_30_54_11 TaxID=1817892 RepID=A0A1J5IID9_9BACT|nr:MAG: cupin [Candidatus Wirthbacteria bacterium CG2_30_54_11]
MTAVLGAEPFYLKDLIDYAPGAIVSKTLVDGPAGTLTLFAFAGGQGLSEHTAPYDAIVQVMDGEGVFVIGGEARTVTAGQMLIMPSDVPHAVQTVADMKMLLTMIRSQEKK